MSKVTIPLKPVAPAGRRIFLHDRMPLIGPLASWPGPWQRLSQGRRIDALVKRRWVPLAYMVGRNRTRPKYPLYHAPLWQQLMRNRGDRPLQGGAGFRPALPDKGDGA